MSKLRDKISQKMWATANTNYILFSEDKECCCVVVIYCLKLEQRLAKRVIFIVA